MKYLLDANVFIQAKNLHYGLDFCPAFWDWVDEKSRAGLVSSIDKVEDELIDYGDELSDWVKARHESLFIGTGASQATRLTDVSNWSMSQNYQQAAINEFF